MTEAQEFTFYERHKENNFRYIRAKLRYASAEVLALTAAFIQGCGVIGFDTDEYNRPINRKEVKA